MSANVPVGDVGHRQNIQEAKRTICPKAFNRLQKFGKGEDSWKDYNPGLREPGHVGDLEVHGDERR